MGYINDDYLRNRLEIKSIDEMLEELKTELLQICADAEKDDRNIYLDEMEDEFWERVNEDPDDLDCTDAAAFATFISAKFHPEWTKQNCQDFFEQVTHSITLGQALIGKNDKEAWKILGDDVKERVGGILNNSKDTCGTDRKPVEVKADKPVFKAGKGGDKEAVDEFLKFMRLK